MFHRVQNIKTTKGLSLVKEFQEIVLSILDPKYGLISAGQISVAELQLPISLNHGHSRFPDLGVF